MGTPGSPIMNSARKSHVRPDILAQLAVGACADPATPDHPDFLSPEHHRQVHAADWCHAAQCPVIIECAAAAVAANDGCVWGGTTEYERSGVGYERRLAGAARAYAARHHDTATPTRAQIAAARAALAKVLGHPDHDQATGDAA